MTKSDNKCKICGRKARNLCISLGTMICSSCCGSKRGMEITCSGECQYYPFSIKGYDLWLKIDGVLSQKIMKYVVSHYDKEEFENVIENMLFQDEPTEHTIETVSGVVFYYLLFVKKDHQGQSLASKWKSQEWQGLTNDECMMMNCRTDNSYATIIEIQKILDHQAMECIDLLDSKQEKFILLDRNVAASVCRFTQLLTWLNHYPYFSRVANNALELTDMVADEFMEALRKSFKKESRKQPQLTIKQYLSENFGSFCRFNFELAQERTRAMLSRMDVHHCKALYTLEGKFEEVKALFDKYPEFTTQERDPEEEHCPGAYYYDWLRRGASKELEKEMPSFFRHKDESQGVGIIGNVSLYPDKLIVETFSKQKYAFAKKMIEKYFKKLVTLKKEAVVDTAKQLANRIDKRDEDFSIKEIMPIPLEDEQEMMQSFYKYQYEKFLDEKIPALNGVTPRQAAKDLSMRPMLIKLMKLHLKGIEEQNKDKNLWLNIDWLLDELKLHELK
ncbi:MAG: hypothetical protein QMD92_06695 [bacterium]|nr:hypothetical protein [bacterium]